ncbi:MULTISPECIES: RNA polymerase recycling motor HelD [unclassified Bacillus (in: firmicutes)]|uniref:RNA polymerase recycling motor HelD n=1 Tax=unclassified Bacillus (in: firmicutes) TaxID=185979 RepID=UPI0008EAB758|nr:MULTISPECIES: RNA polymerase recycling motor HelD [unclassified Bacillus (in: firmicutes)]SFA87992.1 DNA helicase-2 / ATP-dependent DNA helicase PcrA [Bacillus sp. UNCCL13]SFQ84481.1 ATP-dependent DNA helicase, Rep family [Bacillus sp. cl95]
MSENTSKDWQLEQERVDLIVKEINHKMEKLHQHSGKVRSDVKELRKTFWEDVTINLDDMDDAIETHASIKQIAELLSERERSHGQIHQQEKTLSRLKSSPYFGRIDFHETGESSTDQLYLGITSFMDSKDENFLIYDWRAPVSSMYYDYSPGPAMYETPGGRVDGEMNLKRQFIIRNSKIKGMFDTNVTIGDEILQEVLGSSANTQMKSIVATIQREQNQIIRNENKKYIIVQGVAGGGKTSAALQRVAYLLYRYRETLKSENIMLFSPNPLFNSYVSTVLPELGEENMQQSTYQEYLNHRLSQIFELEDRFEEMEYLLSNYGERDYSLRLKSIRYKAGLAFKDRIDEYVHQLSNKGILFKDITFRKNLLVSAEEISKKFYEYDSSYSIANRIELVKNWLLKELKKKAKLEKKKDWVEEEIQLLDKEDYLVAYQELQKKERFTDKSFDDFEAEQEWLAAILVNKRFKPITSKVKKLQFIDHSEIYKQLFKQNINDHLKEIDEFTLENWNGILMRYEDTTPFLYMQDLIEGRKSNTSVRHVFIDEAQDYTPFQFAYIKRLFPFSKMTLLGDINQAIYSGATDSPTILNDGSELFSADETQIYHLMRTYRSTKEIVEFTRALIAGGEQIEPFNRSGEKPTLNIVINNYEQKKLVLSLIEEAKLEGHKTIAIICRTEKESKHLFDALKDHVPMMLVEKGTLSYEKGITIIPAYLAKGIEFDAVILYGSQNYMEESERKLFYTACTRAMHKLNLIAIGSMSPLMKDAPTDTFKLL